jgi:hypothetical protein
MRRCKCDGSTATILRIVRNVWREQRQGNRPMCVDVLGNYVSSRQTYILAPTDPDVFISVLK